MVNEKMKTIGKWSFPQKMFDEYIKFQMFSDGYADKTIKVPSEEMGIKSPVAEQERAMRWQLCVKRVMEIHREICEYLKIKYTTDSEDEFYNKFKAEVRRKTRLRG